MGFSAAFDTIDHSLLLKILENKIGIAHTVKQIFETYLSNRFVQVLVNSSLSDKIQVETRVPQGSVLGPILFILYLQPLLDYLIDSNIAYHFYADDSQLFLEINLMQNNHKLENIEKICSQLPLSLNKNDGKTEVVFFGRQLHHDYLKPVKVFKKEKVPKCFTKLLGFFLDYNMSFEKQINHCCKLCYLELRKSYSIRRFLTLDQRKMFVTSFVLSRLDYCNALYMKVNKILLIKLQKVQNAAARFVLGATRRTASTNELMKKLH